MLSRRISLGRKGFGNTYPPSPRARPPGSHFNLLRCILTEIPKLKLFFLYKYIKKFSNWGSSEREKILWYTNIRQLPEVVLNFISNFDRSISRCVNSTYCELRILGHVDVEPLAFPTDMQRWVTLDLTFYAYVLVLDDCSLSCQKSIV